MLTDQIIAENPILANEGSLTFDGYVARFRKPVLAQNSTGLKEAGDFREPALPSRSC